MYQNTGMYANYEVETNKETYKETKSNYTDMSSASIAGMVTPPVYECPQERVIHREILHEVPLLIYIKNGNAIKVINSDNGEIKVELITQIINEYEL